MSEHNTREWEKEFDKKYIDGDFGITTCDPHVVPLKALKTFIHQELQKAREEEREEWQRLADSAEMLWVCLANVSGGDWSKQTTEWQEAAKRWRDNYFGAVTKTDQSELEQLNK